MKSMHKNWNITVLFIIHEDFDRAWAEHYPVTLSAFLAIHVPCLVPIGVFLQWCLVKSAKGSRSDLTTSKVSHKFMNVIIF